MGITAWTGPLVSFGRALVSTASTAATLDANESQGPSLFYQGQAILDHRPFYTYKPGAASSAPVYGWWGTDRILCIDKEISAPGENTLALTQSATTTTVRSLVISSIDSANATANVSIKRADTGATVTGLLAIEGAASTITFGSAATINCWDPSTMVARTVRIEGSSDDSGGAFTVTGYDVYGYPMAEVIPGSISTTAGSTFKVGVKAFKYIATISASGTINSTGITVGVTDTLGLPIYFKSPTQVVGAISSATTSWGYVMTSTSPVIPGSTASTQVSTGPDVRGTWLSTTACSSQGRRIQIYVSPDVATLNSTGLFGAAQYSG